MVGFHPGGLFKVLHQEQVRQVPDIAENVVLLIRGDAGTSNSNHAGYVRRAKGLPRCPAAGLYIQERHWTGGLAAIADEKDIIFVAPA